MFLVPKSTFSKLEHPQNIACISVTLEKSNFDKSTEGNSVQPWNISPINTRLGVFGFPKLTLIKLEQPQNVASVLKTLVKSKFDKSIDCNLIQF